MNKLYLITGPAGVGKSTVSKYLANNMEKSALIEGDDIYHFVKGGHIPPWLEGNHLELSWKNNVDLINNFLSEGYNVVFNYIIRQDKLDMLLSEFRNFEVKFVVLMVDKKTLIERDKERPLECQMGIRSVQLLEQFKNQNYDEKYILNTSDLSIEDTVKIIIDDKRFVVCNT